MAQPDDESPPGPRDPALPHADGRRVPASSLAPTAPGARPDDPDRSTSAFDGDGDGRKSAVVSRGRRALGVALGILALIAAALAILWLPPSDDVRAAAEATVLAYELATEATWPKGAPLGQPLSPAAEHLLAVTLRTRVGRYAAGDALARFDAAAAAAAFADAAAADLVHAVTRWKGEVVYFEFVRHALPDGVIVRVGVLKAQRVGRVDALHQRVFARRWVWHEEVEIGEYRVREVDGVWKVVDVEPWGTCDADGANVIEDRRPT